MKLDHIVYFSNSSPEQVVAQQRSINRHAVIGGRHEKWGTSNALLYTRNAYIEWLCIDNIIVAQKAIQPLTSLLLHDLKSGEGWGTICLSVNNIENFEREINRKGFKTSGVIDGQRKTPDGQLRKWKMLFINQSGLDRLPFPFFIEWGESEAVRFAALRRDGTILPSNERIKVNKCIFESADPVKNLQEWSHLLSCEIVSGNQFRLPNIVLQFEKLRGQKRERLSEVLYS